IEPGSWGRGYATEAVRGMIPLARLLGHRRIVGRPAADNPASERVLRKAGFRPTGRARPFHSLGRSARIEAPEYALDLCETDCPGDAPMRQAAGADRACSGSGGKEPLDHAARQAGGPLGRRVEAAPAAPHFGKNVLAALDDRAEEGPRALHAFRQDLRDHGVFEKRRPAVGNLVL